MPQQPTTRLSREEIAAIEVGHTDISPALARWLAGGFIACIAAMPVIQIVSEWRAAPSRLPQPFEIVYGVADAARTFRRTDGFIVRRAIAANGAMLRSIADYEDALGRNSILTRRWLGPAQAFMAGRLGVGNEQAYVGRGGWLFYRPGVDAVMGPGFLSPWWLRSRGLAGSKDVEPPRPDPRPAILDFHRQLRERGIQLVIVPAPDKAAVHPERLSSRFQPSSVPLANPSMPEFVESMRAEGVLVFDPAARLAGAHAASGEPQFIETDTHWTPAAMERVAADLAGFIRANVDLPAGNDRLQRRPVEATALGDIAVMLQLPAGQTLYPRQTITVQQVFEPSTRLLWQPRKDASVLLLGDSYANVFSLEDMGWGASAGLAEQVSFHLGLPVDVLVRNDAGAHATRRMLSRDLARGRDRLQGKKVVVWEFAARELAVGHWPLIPMAVGRPAPSGFFVPPASTRMWVNGTVQAAAAVPRPRTVPYKDHIRQIHLRDVRDDAGRPVTGGEALVSVWSMRDNTWTRAARFREGQSVRLRIERWEGGPERRYGSINQSRLGEQDIPNADDVEACWGEDPDDPTATTAPPVALSAQAVNGPVAPRAVGPEPAEGRGLAAEFADDCRRHALAGDTLAVPGRDGWLFLRGELAHLGKGRFWGETAAVVSASHDPSRADPLPAILSFHSQLEALGIRLLLVPVPPKAVLYPALISDAAARGISNAPPRLDPHLQEFYRELRRRGVAVLDLTDEMLAHAATGDDRLYCRTDTHWSGQACVLAAERIASEFRGVEGVKAAAKREYRGRLKSVTFTGDLVGTAGSNTVEGLARETMPLRFVYPADDETGVPDTDETSPVLVIGDSFCLIFHSGRDMYAKGAGLPDQLALALGFPVDVIARRAGGSTDCRQMLYQKARKTPGYVEGKKAVIWCFNAAEFTENTAGWAVKDVVKRQP